ncbi:aquaporin FA-CHIP-like [Sardina pilchardus]|uniref:aquaporin FA-CHIP-like n=1 Tax=Sardina pilchardus TaxID=27697 RepID=UPI002E0D2355
MATEMKTLAFWRAVLAELVGMILFIFIGITAAIGNQNNSGPDQEVKVALAFGLAIATLAQSLGHISGAHLNPAVTLGLLASCRISLLRAVFYIAAQMLGAILASAVTLGLRPASINALGLNQLNGVNAAQGFGIEFLLTLQLVLCVIATTDKGRRDVSGSAPLAIGLSVGLGHLGGLSYTGCGINPARSFGPAVILRNFDYHWVYWAGPMSGGIVAALLYNLLLSPKLGDLPENLKVLCHGDCESEREPLLDGAEGDQWAKQ